MMDCVNKFFGITMSNLRRIRLELPSSPLKLVQRMCSVLFLKKFSIYIKLEGKVDQIYEEFTLFNKNCLKKSTFPLSGILLNFAFSVVLFSCAVGINKVTGSGFQ